MRYPPSSLPKREMRCTKGRAEVLRRTCVLPIPRGWRGLVVALWAANAGQSRAQKCKLRAMFPEPGAETEQNRAGFRLAGDGGIRSPATWGAGAGEAVRSSSRVREDDVSVLVFTGQSSELFAGRRAGRESSLSCLI